VPATHEFAKTLQEGQDTLAALKNDSRVAREKTEEIKMWVAKRGRAAYSGDRSRGTYDAGSVAIAIMTENLVQAFEQTPPHTTAG
jgi:hypothetical protein